MKLVYRILLKVGLLVIILVIFNKIYTLFFYEKDIQQNSEIINQVRNVVKKNSEVVYLGESSNGTSRDDDLDNRAISQMLADYYPSLKIDDISKGAIHAGNYEILLKNIPEKSSIKTVIVTLNLRSFDADWIYSRLETSLQKSMVMLLDYPPLVKRFLLSFKGYDHKSENERKLQVKLKWLTTPLIFPYPFKYKNVIEWDNAKALEGTKNEKGIIDQNLTSLACHYVKTYAFQIDTSSNPRIKNFDNIVALAAKRHWNLVFNLMAENTEMANELIGKDLIYLMEQNRKLLVDRYTRKGVIVVDNFNCVPDEEYIDRNWTTEHYAEFGRKLIAKNLADSLRKIYPADYKKVIYPVLQSLFFNNCDSVSTWGQVSTLSTEKAFSGKKSSKTDGNNPYSITFEYPLRKLPRNFDTVDVELLTFATCPRPRADIVVDVSGKNIDYIWMTYPIDSIAALERWQKVSHSFRLPLSARRGDNIKVYLYNISGKVLYVDDIRIKCH